ncbi:MULTISPECIES: glycosyltransferase family 4 protein [Campylobacter]|uniref:Glycosyltransferase family 4 protein n=1 Tax=Campylobacter porcelli TaxID=1660073 RepID=A0A1X9SY98_9BACT|nr:MULTISPECIES: glycosyltransferase family 4 protein [unclassified Campylobacter]ARR01156.1 hypothetical protein CSUIS_1364 [Campylobacter sp. RM6137]MCR8697144.1 glycosyltransferase family 4 protein [Campylobacter sp. RM19073]MEE3705551.1 glycosyltransferase family 4 protein [Campylobacter sp. CX2-8023-23]MEE3745257.1 glycosyltransferase family 4 protein [Campylobacter sp. CX2-4855-23]
MHSRLLKLTEIIKSQGYENICFFQPVHAITGATTCKVQMAEYLANNTNLNIYFCDLIDGHPRTLIKNIKNINFIPYDPNSELFPLNKKCVIFATSTRVILLKNMHKDNKIIFWHNETNPCAWDLLFLNNETLKFFNLIKHSRAIMFHDWSSMDSINRYSNANIYNNDFYYLTVPNKTLKAPKELLDIDYINIGFLSRLSADKIQSLFYLAKNLYEINISKKIRLHIIGDGVYRKKVEQELMKYGDKIDILYTGSIAYNQLDEYLINNIDLLYGVGTCVIEASALRIPSAVLLMNTNEIQDNQVYWYFDTNCYCTGITVDQKKDFNIKYISIANSVETILLKNGKRNIGNKCYQYYKNNHGNINKLASIFLEQIINSSLTFDKLKRVIRYTPYSLIKVIRLSILGLKLFKKIDFVVRTDFYIFGIRYFRINRRNGINKYYLFGIKIISYKEYIPYKFPNSMGKKVHYANKKI